jgi:mono/diheme cytochrome c family protein
MKRLLPALLLLATPATVWSATEPGGKEIFQRHCVHCHAPGHENPGTRQLAMTRGENRAVLEERRDLTADYIEYIVRHGLMSMPAFVPSDLTDTQLRALTDYLTRSPSR